AVARRDSDASLGVERNDRRSVKRRFHWAPCPTFFYLLPPYRQITRPSRPIFQAVQALTVIFYTAFHTRSRTENQSLIPLSECASSTWLGCHNWRPRMIDKTFASAEAALADVADGASIMIGGFGNAGMPAALIDEPIAQGARELIIVNNNAGNADTGLAALIAAKRVRKILCSFPRQADSWHFDRAYRAGEIQLELVPQGTLAERIRAAGAGVGAFYTPT